MDSHVPDPTAAGGAPVLSPPDAETDLDSALVATATEMMARGRTVVVTGAGISTDSGIPDYRGAGAIPRTPMTFQQFLEDPASRRRYWAGSHAGWQRFSQSRPNAGHRVLARLEKRAFVTGVITQNVDGLHQRAGSHRVVELHGSLNRVRCLDCGHEYPRHEIGALIDQAVGNAGTGPASGAPTSLTDVSRPDLRLAPDGDVQQPHAQDFPVPACPRCGGNLKPDVVFFGELIPTPTYLRASALIQEADTMLIAGSSLVVNSGIRLLEQARRAAMPVIIINRGQTRGDGAATVRLEGGTSEILAAIESNLIDRL